MRTRILSLAAAALLSLAALPLAGNPARAQDTEALEMLMPWRSKSPRGINDFQLLKFRAEDGDRYAQAVQDARALVALARYAEAFARFEEAARLDRARAPYDEWADALEASGDVPGAIALYRQIAFRTYKPVGPDGKPQEGPQRDFIDAQGRSLRALVRQTDGGDKPVDQSSRPATLMRYALLLSRAGQYAEAAQAYRWGYEETENWIKADFRPQFDLQFSPRRFDKALFEAAARTVIGLTEDTYRTERFSKWPPSADIEQYERAIAVRRSFAPAYLLLGGNYQEKEYLDDGYRPRAVSAYRDALRIGDAVVRERAQKALADLASR